MATETTADAGVDEWREMPAIVPRPADDPAMKQARRRLRQAVVDEVAKRGYQATSVTTIVAAARVSRSTFYSMYQGKDDCFLDAYAAVHRRFVRAVSQLPETGANPEEALVRGIDAYLAGIFVNAAAYHAFQRELPMTGPAGVTARTKVFDAWAQLLHRRIGAALDAEPALSRGRSLADVQIIFALLFGANELIVQAIEAGDERPSYQLRRNIIRMMSSAVSLDAELDTQWAETVLARQPGQV